MKIKTILLFISTLLFVNLAFASDNQIVYQCGFEDGENMSVWDLQTADKYLAADPEYQGYRNYFFVGTATAYEGSKSLYVSNDNGLSNIMTASLRSNGTGSSADLQLTLASGHYTMDFVYKLKSPQSASIIFSADRFDFDSYMIPGALETTDTWTSKHFDFTITETKNWITFWYEFNTRNGGETDEGCAIDNIVIRKISDFVIDENNVLIDYIGLGGNVIIPDSVKSIDETAFLNKGNLITSFFIPASLETIEEGSLSWDSITNITVDKNNPNYISIDGVLYKDTTTIICYPAQKAGDSFVIPKTVTTIGAYAFYSCSNLTSITIPDGVEKINEGAISYCPNLSSITIPNSVTSIGQLAFYQNPNMLDVFVKWQDPTTLSYENNSFRLTLTSSYTLHVPVGTVDLYTATSPWSIFARNSNRIVEDISTGTTNALASKPNIYVSNRSIVVENTTAPIQIYNVTGSLVATGIGSNSYAVRNAGIYIVKVGEVVTKVIVK